MQVIFKRGMRKQNVGYELHHDSDVVNFDKQMIEVIGKCEEVVEYCKKTSK